MDMVLFPLLCLYLFAPPCESSVLKSQKSHDVKSQAKDWVCPDSLDLEGITCSCGVPHTVRCKGVAISPEILKIFTKKLSNDLKSDEIISLLDLSVHHIKSLPAGLFAKLKLMGLVINGAGLVDVNPGTFDGLEDDLAALGLPANNLTIIPSESLEGLYSLRWLDLGTNQIPKISVHGFPALPQLDNLNLDNNQLKILETEAFAQVPHLKILNLSKNKLDITQLNERSLYGLHFLKEINLQSNLLKGALSPTFLSSVPSLQVLDLSHNFFTNVTLNALSGCEALEKLDLSHNLIDVIEDHAFQHLTQLKSLELSHNRIVAVSGWSLAQLGNLHYLGIADNSLLAVTADLLHQIPELSKLDVSANDITIIQPEVFNYTKSLLQVDLSDNPLHCDCSLTWLWKWLQQDKLSTKTKLSAVCATPPSQENAILADLKPNELVCQKEGTDYYHDAAIDYGESTELHISEAEISLRKAKWAESGIQLTWNVEQKAIPYTCQSLHIYEMTLYEGTLHQVLANSIELNCTSDNTEDPNTVVITVPEDTLSPGRIFRYCLVLIERGTSDDEEILPGCSEPLPLQSKGTMVSSLTAGTLGNDLMVQIKFNQLSQSPCAYNLYRLKNTKIEEVTELDCTETRHKFSSVPPGNYVVCIDTNKLDISDIKRRLTTSSLDQALSVFPACTTVDFETDNVLPPPVMTLIFTIPGFALIIAIYLVVRRTWKGRVPWKWDPRATKRAKYFLYTGESSSPNVSMDPLPIILANAESTTRV